MFKFYLYILFGVVSLSASAENILKLSTAEKIIATTDVPPVFAGAINIKLPDFWQHEPDGFYGNAWYQLQFSAAPTNNQQLAVLLADVNMNAEVWLNGVRLGSGGSMLPPLSRYWHSPLMFVFSPTDLKQKNTLSIRIVAYANRFGQLGNVYIGPYDEIRQQYDLQVFSSVTIHIISGVLAAVYALFMAIVWWQRKDPVFFWGSIVCGVWSLSSMNLYINNPIIGELMWEKTMLISVGWIPLLFYFFIRRLDQVSYKFKPEGWILLAAILLNVAVMASAREQIFHISPAWHVYSLAFGLLAVIRVVVSWLRERKQPHFIMMIAFFLIMLCGVHDFLVQNQVLNNNEVFWLDYSVPVILLLIGYLMVSRFLMAVDDSERLNRELESRVSDALEKIESDYERILMLETEQASNRERERIYRDMHDDMGAKLLSMVYKAESNEMHALARSAMNDLRAIVSKKPGKKYRLVEILSRWEKTTVKRCKDAGFKCDWSQDVIPGNIYLNMEADQNLQRIQSESITNALKHSRGNSIAVNVRCRFGCLSVTVADNGDYSNIEQWQEGRGVSSMCYRIEQLHGKINWRESNTGGGRVRWLIPVDVNSVENT